MKSQQKACICCILQNNYYRLFVLNIFPTLIPPSDRDHLDNQVLMFERAAGPVFEKAMQKEYKGHNLCSAVLARSSSFMKEFSWLCMSYLRHSLIIPDAQDVKQGTLEIREMGERDRKTAIDMLTVYTDITISDQDKINLFDSINEITEQWVIYFKDWAHERRDFEKLPSGVPVCAYDIETPIRVYALLSSLKVCDALDMTVEELLGYDELKVVKPLYYAAFHGLLMFRTHNQHNVKTPSTEQWDWETYSSFLDKFGYISDYGYAQVSARLSPEGEDKLSDFDKAKHAYLKLPRTVTNKGNKASHRKNKPKKPTKKRKTKKPLKLTDEQIELLELLENGTMSQREMAEKLNTSESAISNRIKRLEKKLRTFSIYRNWFKEPKPRGSRSVDSSRTQQLFPNTIDRRSDTK